MNPTPASSPQPLPQPTGMTVPIAVVGTLMGLLVIAVMLLVMFRVHPQTNSVPRLVDGKTPEEVLRQLRAESGQRLETYGWVDKANGVVHIPLETAMEKFLLEQASSSRPTATPR